MNLKSSILLANKVCFRELKLLRSAHVPFSRAFSATVYRCDKKKDDAEKEGEQSKEKEGWFRRFMPVRGAEAGTQPHSRLLSDKDVVYEIQIHSVKPEFMESYLKEFHRFVDIVHAKNTGAELAGSWTTEIGEQDDAIHLWKYTGGYPVLDDAKITYRSQKEFVDFRLNRNKMLRSRKNQILLAFSFWNEIQPRQGSNIYELRSYTLKPGTMIEWGNNWSRGIRFRQDKNEAVAGYFTHIGDVYQVYHLWSYESLESRKQIRENAWIHPGWNDLVANTVPLIRHMQSRILIPTPFSPLQ